MSCSNCYNGCSQITSDQCVRYTGVDVPILDIKNGDTLSHVEQQLISFLTSTLDGSGINIEISQSIICQIVSKNLPTSGDLNVVDFIKALIQAVCELKTLVDGTIADIDDIDDFITDLESAYDLSGDCLTDDTPGLTPTSGTHDILQAVIKRLCRFITLGAPGTYVKINDLDALIGFYLSNLPGASKYYTKMVPYVAVPFFPTPAILANFSGSGVGSGDWEKIYFCNGQTVSGYQTPDMRGRVPVGVTDGTMGGGSFPAQTAPGGLNPTYIKGAALGNNGITLDISQIPQHNHPGSTIVIDQDPHRHNYTTGSRDVDGWQGDADIDDLGPITAQTSDATVTLRPTLTIAPQGGNQAHSNVQPGMGCFYIMYIP